MAYKVTENTFYSNLGNRYDLEIWSNNYNFTGNTFTTGKGGFKLSYKGNDDRRNVVMPSELSFNYIVTYDNRVVDETILNKILIDASKEWFIIVKRNFVVFWWGGLEGGFDTLENDYFPYSVKLTANDYLGDAINRKDYLSIADYSKTKISNYTAKMYTDNAGFITNNYLADCFPLGENELLYRINNRWKPDNISGFGTSNNSLALLAVDQKAFLASSNESNKYYPAKAFKDCLRCLGLKMFQADGKINIIQNKSYVSETIDFTKVKYTELLTQTGTGYEEDYSILKEVQLDNSVTPTVASGFKNKKWIEEPVDITDTIWLVNSATKDSAKQFTATGSNSYVYRTLPQGQYRVSFSSNDTNVSIAYTNLSAGILTTLLTESGEANFELTDALGGIFAIKTTQTSGTNTFDNVSIQLGTFIHRTFLNGQQWRFERPLSIVKGTFQYGVDHAVANSNFPSSGLDTTYAAPPYVSALTSIGAFSTAAADNLLLRINLFHAEFFDYDLGALVVTHIGGSITMKLKLGSYYLTGTVDEDLSWTLVDSNFILNIPINPIIVLPTTQWTTSTFLSQTGQEYCNVFEANTSSDPYYTASDGTASYIGANKTFPLPSAPAGGDVQLQFVSATNNVYNNPDTSNPSVSPTPLTITKNNLVSRWFTGSNLSNFSNSSLLGSPTYFQLTFAGQALDEQAVEYSASASLENFEVLDFGELPIGTTGTEDSTIYSLLAWNGSFFEQPISIQVNGTGTAYNMCSLLLKEYIQPQTLPLRIIDGDLLINDFSAFNSLDIKTSLNSSFDGNNEGRYALINGTFTAETDTFSGSYYKTNSGESTTVTLADIDLPNTIKIPDRFTFSPPLPPYPNDPTFGEFKIINDNLTDPYFRTLPSDSLLNVVKFNSIGLTSADLVAGTSYNKVDVINNSRCKLFDNQKLMLYRADFSNVMILTKDGDSTISDTALDTDSYTPSVNYAKGSILALATYDINNNITTGTSTPNLYKGVTTTAIHIKADDFKMTSSSTIRMYSRDDLGSVQPSSYAARTSIYASSFIPENYKLTHVDIYSSQNRTFTVKTARTINDSVTSIMTGGTANTTLAISPNWTSVLGDYVILVFELGASNDEIYGAKLTIEAV
tara:strand:+ start:7089 stop:10448 length:3360 start_codon:yes stop_codon:yes gene_type:complete